MLGVLEKQLDRYCYECEKNKILWFISKMFLLNNLFQAFNTLF